jgi:hypothetical protein
LALFDKKKKQTTDKNLKMGDTKQVGDAGAQAATNDQVRMLV